MKKVLFATTALVASSVAGAALADVEVSGEARLGLFYQSDFFGLADDDDIDGTSRVRVKFALSGTSDSGLTFGANIRADNAGGGTDQGGEQPFASELDDIIFPDDFSDDMSGHVSTGGDVFVSGSFGTVTFGDTDSAVKKRVSNVTAISLTGLGDVHEINRGSQSGPRIRYDYDFDSFGFSLSTEGEIDGYAIGASYSGDFGGTTIDFGIGYDDTETASFDIAKLFDLAGGSLGYDPDGLIAASLGVGFGAFGFDVAYSTDQEVDDLAVSVSYDAGDLDVAAYYRMVDAGDGFIEADVYGLGASYDLGGGLVAKAGVANVAIDGVDDDFLQADMGLAMTF